MKVMFLLKRMEEMCIRDRGESADSGFWQSTNFFAVLIGIMFNYIGPISYKEETPSRAGEMNWACPVAR